MKKIFLIGIVLILFSSAAMAVPQFNRFFTYDFFGSVAYGSAIHIENALKIDNESAWLFPCTCGIIIVKGFNNPEHPFFHENPKGVKVGIKYEAPNPFCGTKIELSKSLNGTNWAIIDEFTVEQGNHSEFFYLPESASWKWKDIKNLQIRARAKWDCGTDSSFSEYPDGWIGIDSIYLKVLTNCRKTTVGGRQLIQCEEKLMNSI